MMVLCMCAEKSFGPPKVAATKYEQGIRMEMTGKRHEGGCVSVLCDREAVNC